MARQHSAEGVELNVTAMLDMAFQLLAFFILTFRPGPSEPAVQLHLPPAQPMVVGCPSPGQSDLSNIKLAGINTLRINLFSTGGGLDRMTINDLPADTFDVLRDNMRRMLTEPGSPIEQVVVQASESLHYNEVIKVIGICSEQKLPKTGKFVKLNLVAMGER
ncbi:MAG: biopolymer transporter ExbD [Planctomycetota bacterium]